MLALSGAGDLRTVAALADRLADTELVVGIGGGSLLDQAKLATLIRANPDAYARLTVPQRSGLLVLGPGTTRSLPLVAVPTTVGTGTEFSGVACLSYPEQGKRLVMGTALRPKVAVLDPVATGTLDDELIAEGVLEALFRVVSPYVGDHGDLPTEDALVETIAQRLVLLGHEVRDARRAGYPPTTGCGWRSRSSAVSATPSGRTWAVTCTRSRAGSSPTSCPPPSAYAR